MKFLNKILKRRFKVGAYFGSTAYELMKFMKDIGKSEFKDDTIILAKYPFAPSKVYPKGIVRSSEIEECLLDHYPPAVKVKNELIFISGEKLEDLRNFCSSNKIRINKRESNWTLLTEPFLDTEFDEEQKEMTIHRLIKNGFSIDEIKELREEIGEQMYKYNFDTMLREWAILSIYDVLSAMQPKYEKEEFKNFFWKAMEIELRTEK